MPKRQLSGSGIQLNSFQINIGVSCRTNALFRWGAFGEVRQSTVPRPPAPRSRVRAMSARARLTSQDAQAKPSGLRALSLSRDNRPLRDGLISVPSHGQYR
jgi:hypothetical protein